MESDLSPVTFSRGRHESRSDKHPLRLTAVVIAWRPAGSVICGQSYFYVAALRYFSLFSLFQSVADVLFLTAARGLNIRSAKYGQV